MGLFKDKWTAEYGNHKIEISAKTGAVNNTYSFEIDGKFTDSSASIPLISVGQYEMHGLIQEGGIDKPVKVLINQGLVSTNAELYVSGNRIPIRRIK